MAKNEFYHGKPCVKCESTERYKNGDCRPCSIKRASVYQKNNKDRVNKKNEKWRLRNLDKSKRYAKKWREENREFKNKIARNWRENNPDKFIPYNRYAAGKRRALKANATPKWADEELIRLIYEECPEGCCVDHIIPLKNEDVCGLHSHQNLQYLPNHLNQKKYNHFNSEVLKYKRY